MSRKLMSVNGTGKVVFIGINFLYIEHTLVIYKYTLSDLALMELVRTERMIIIVTVRMVLAVRTVRWNL